MFEKESEEYADKYENNRGSLEWWGLRNSYQLGAAFGYDKANEYAKVIIQDLLDNSDEYARQRAIDWLEEN